MTDAPTLEAIYRLRAQVWHQSGHTAPAAFADGRWSDAHDATGTHRVFRDGDAVVAAARQSVHARLAEVPEAEVYAAVGLALAGRVAAPAHLVVAPAARRHGLAWRLADAQNAAARAAGCRFSVCQSAPDMAAMLLRRGWRVIGPGPPDDRFPGLRFDVMVLKL